MEQGLQDSVTKIQALKKSLDAERKQNAALRARLAAIDGPSGDGKADAEDGDAEDGNEAYDEYSYEDEDDETAAVDPR